jgi:hypothetical protein
MSSTTDSGKEERVCPICKKGKLASGDAYCKNSCRKKAQLSSKYYKIYSIGGR